MAEKKPLKKLIAKTVKPAKPAKAPARKTGKLKNSHLPDELTQLHLMNDDRQYGSGQRNKKADLPRGIKRKPAKKPRA